MRIGSIAGLKSPYLGIADKIWRARAPGTGGGPVELNFSLSCKKPNKGGFRIRTGQDNLRDKRVGGAWVRSR